MSGGNNGLGGRSALAVQTECPLGTCENLGGNALTVAGSPCGYGAEGIDNLWFDLDAQGEEIFAGVNPVWHTNNLRDGLPTPYLTAFGHEDEPRVGDYVGHVDNIAQSTWLWNEQKGGVLING